MPMRGSRAARRRTSRSATARWIAARLQRLPQAIPFADGASCRCAACRTASPIAPRARHGLDRSGATACPALRRGRAARISPRRVTDYLKREARRDLDAASRAMRRRSASRSSASRARPDEPLGLMHADGVLSYSWRLILAPPFVLDYLAAHEVAHLVEMNHSAALLAAGARICPDGARQERGSTRTATSCIAMGSAAKCTSTPHSRSRTSAASMRCIGVVRRRGCDRLRAGRARLRGRRRHLRSDSLSISRAVEAGFERPAALRRQCAVAHRRAGGDGIDEAPRADPSRGRGSKSPPPPGRLRPEALMRRRMKRVQMSTGMPPPVSFLVGELSSLPSQTPVTRLPV